MFGKILGAIAGSQLAEKTKKIDGPMGAVLGVVGATALKRMSLPVLVALTAGGYFAKKHFDKQKARNETLHVSPSAI